MQDEATKNKGGTRRVPARGAWAAEQRAFAATCKRVRLGAVRRRVLDALEEAVTTHGAFAARGPKGWADKGPYAALRKRVKPSRLDPFPRLASSPSSARRRLVHLP